MLFGFKVITPYCLAQICLQTYAVQPAMTIGAWEFLSKSVLNDQGYSAVAYIHATENMVIIAHAATDPLLLGILLSHTAFLPPHLSAVSIVAKNFSEKVRKSVSSQPYTVIETGQLLGAFHAEMNVALFNNGYAATFDSPGISEMCAALSLTPDQSHFMGFFSQPTVLNTAKRHVGSLHRIYTYHVEERGPRRGEAEIQLLTQRLSQLALPLEPNIRVGDRIQRKILAHILQPSVLSAQLEKLIQAMHPQIEYPWLWRHILSWPTLTQQLTATGNLSLGSVNSSLLSPYSSSSTLCSLHGFPNDGLKPMPTVSSLVNQNQRAEQELQSLAGSQLLPAKAGRLVTAYKADF